MNPRRAVANRETRAIALSRLLCLFLVATFAAVGCSVFIDVSEEQCSSQDDCDRRGATFAGRMCLDRVCRFPATSERDAGGDVDAPLDEAFACMKKNKPTADPSVKVKFGVPLYSILSNEPAPGVGAKVCSRPDQGCAAPLESTSTKADGLLTANASVGFEGFFEINDPQYTKTLFMLNPPLAKDVRLPATPLVVDFLVQSYARMLLGAPNEADLGYMLIRATDCKLAYLKGMTVELSVMHAKTKRFFVTENTPRVDIVATTEEGAMGFFNVPTGSVVVTLNEQATGRRLGSSSVIVRAGWLSYIYLTPSP